jgi:DNA-binding response OmpR family regulator
MVVRHHPSADGYYAPGEGWPEDRSAVSVDFRQEAAEAPSVGASDSPAAGNDLWYSQNNASDVPSVGERQRFWGSQTMHHKNILLISRTTRHHERMREVSHALDVSTLLSTPDTFDQAITSGHDFDLVILDVGGMTSDLMNRVDAYVIDNGCIPMLLVVDEEKLPSLRIPVQGRADFILSSAGESEFEVRMSQLLWPGEENTPSDIISIDNMTINLATYQVYVDERPVDLTLMEYSLLSFLATHPSRAYSREALLHRVWGFEYCGGTRTVDVHVRRVRSKVGPQVAAHIATVRGVGYLFKL